MAGSTRFFNRPTGRFFRIKDERQRIDAGMEDYQTVFGAEVDWFFYESGESVVDDVYDEGSVFGGKVYRGPVRIPVLSVVPTQGAEQADDQGFATYDSVALRMSYTQARKAGLDYDLIRDRETRLLDRFVYRRRVFDVESIQTAGHFDPTSSDTTIAVLGVQLRPDELLDSPSFAKYSG